MPVGRVGGGSAPWVRGTLTAIGLISIIKRFSPVGTGNTTCWSHSSQYTPVQPRGYGEHCESETEQDVDSGSAPWVRGTPVIFSTVLAGTRFSPVGTGNTYAFFVFVCFYAVQPRGYGEHFCTKAEGEEE